ncbi:MAG: 6-carboxytetrahydropterin synthase QueD [Candidatus Omnitrophota bacterium]
MYSVKIEAHFSSAHYLKGYKGKCEGMHGHNWKVEAVVERKFPDKAGMVIDFHELKDKLNKIIEKLDHKCLNDLAYFKKVNPTSENIAQYIYANLKVPGLKTITVWESHNSSASYYE